MPRPIVHRRASHAVAPIAVTFAASACTYAGRPNLLPKDQRPPTTVLQDCRKLPVQAFTDHLERQTALISEARRPSPYLHEQFLGVARGELVAHPDLLKFNDDSFRTERPIAFLRTDRKYRMLDSGTYCLTARYENGAPSDPKSWKIEVRSLADQNLRSVARMPFLYRLPDEARLAAPSPAVRFEFLTKAEIDGYVRMMRSGRQGAPGRDPMEHGALATTFAAPLSRRDEDSRDGWYMSGAWFRCGAGCCSGGFDLEFYQSEA